MGGHRNLQHTGQHANHDESGLGRSDHSGSTEVSKFLSSLDVTLLDDASNDFRGTWRLDSPLV